MKSVSEERPCESASRGPLSAACDIDLAFTTGGDAEWFRQTSETYDGEDAAQSGQIDDDEETWLQTTVEGTGIIKFWWKVSCDGNDAMVFYIDGSRKAGRAGIDSTWHYISKTIDTTGTHTLRWLYRKNSSGAAGSDCAWVDCVQWTGMMPDANDWDEIEYVYDLSGRRIEKKVDGTTELKFLYDGDQIIAEYDANDTLLRKYVHGPCIDEPICLIENSGTYAGTQYYHYDALGSVMALTDPNGDVVQLYEYSVYGQVAASDPNHPNRFMFTSREFDKDTGLYYYRARYYNPEIGRFLQTDPIGYGDGMNWYRYCRNDPIICIDPSGQFTEAIAKAAKLWGEVSAFFDYPFMVKIVIRGGNAFTYTYRPTSRWDMYYDMFWADMEVGDEIISLQIIGHGVDKETGWLAFGPDDAPENPITGPKLAETLGTALPCLNRNTSRP